MAMLSTLEPAVAQWGPPTPYKATAIEIAALKNRCDRQAQAVLNGKANAIKLALRDDKITTVKWSYVINFNQSQLKCYFVTTGIFSPPVGYGNIVKENILFEANLRGADDDAHLLGSLDYTREGTVYARGGSYEDKVSYEQIMKRFDEKMEATK